MANKRPFQQYSGRSSSEIANLRKRGPKFWKFVDWAMSEQNKNLTIKKDLTIKFLDKSLPSKIEGDFKVEGAEAYQHRLFERLGIPLEN